jgi:hypothetical protein
MSRCTRTSPSPNSTVTIFLAPAQPLSNPAGAEPFDPFMNFNFKSHRREDDPLEEADEGWQCEAFPTRLVYTW